jgi:putative acetyltransferase
MLIHEERPTDQAAIRALNRSVFKGDYEADLVDRLRADGLVACSLVAQNETDLIGHILFSQLQVEVDDRPIPAVSLAPMAVTATHQRQGIGQRLVEAGLAVVRGGDTAAVLVLGHLWFYPRFGFSAQTILHLASPFQGNPAFMALELKAGCLSGEKGKVTYPAAFGL